MSIEIADDLQPFVASLLASGKCSSEAQVVDRALRAYRAAEEEQRARLREMIEEGMNAPVISSEEFFAKMSAVCDEIEKQG